MSVRQLLARLNHQPTEKVTPVTPQKLSGLPCKPASLQAVTPVTPVTPFSEVTKAQEESFTPAEFEAELCRVAVTIQWVCRVADLGTIEERAELSRLIDIAMMAEGTGDLAALRTVGKALADLAWAIGARVRGEDGAVEDLDERRAIQDVH